jgi:glycerol-3-phosphate dehydrogenase
LALNYAELTGLQKDSDRKIAGVCAIELLNNTKFEVSSKTVINATGVWVDDILTMDKPEHEKHIRPSQGVHIVLKKEFLAGNHALMIPKTSDGRVLFAVPWHNHLVVGTTDTPINSSDAEPIALEQEVQFILETASNYLDRKVERSDVLSIFAGLRPLAAPKNDKSKTKEISRNHKILVSDSLLITVIGGKWTTYRKMAQDMIDTAIKKGLLKGSKSPTKEFNILGSASKTSDENLSKYAENGDAIFEMIKNNPALSDKLHPELPYTWAEVEWMCNNEMIVHLEDLLARRLRALLLNARASSEIAEEVANRVAPLLNWNDERLKAEVKSFRELAKNYMLS